MEALASGLISFLLFHFASHPKSRIHKKIPRKKISRIQLFPSVTVEVKNHVFHFHHWMILGSVLASSFVIDKAIMRSDLLQGFLAGGMAQGFLYGDRFHLIHNLQEYRKFKESTYNLSFLRKLI